MICNLEQVKAYILHCPKNPDRLVNIQKLCDHLAIHYQIIVSNITEYSHQKNVAAGSLSLINCAIDNNIYPLLFLEDDATIISTIPSKIDIPESADLIYWGSNKNHKPTPFKHKLRIENYNSNYYRVYNSQSSHAILVPNKKSSMFLQKIYQDSFNRNYYHDIMLANLSNKKIFLTPKDGPYFYQNDGKNNYITKFKWAEFNSQP